MRPLTLALGGALVVGGIFALDRIAALVVRPARRLPERSVPELGVAHEDFTIRSGPYRLAAWLLLTEREETALRRPLILLAHGWGASYGTVLGLGEPLVRAGYDVLLFDVSGHGRNGPAPYVTIRHFRDDVAAVARYARERFPHRPLVLVGHSMGGAAGILAAADGAPLDALALVAAPADVLRVTAEFLIDQGMPGNAMVRLLRPFWWWRVGGTFLSLTPSRRIGELNVPMVIIQPEHDRRVDRSHAERLAAAARLDYHLVAGREHTDVLGAPETLRMVLELAERVRDGHGAEPAHADGSDGVNPSGAAGGPARRPRPSRPPQGRPGRSPTS